uniref:RING-CH-type domain-containing protein n=1 Tax=Cannabis sativa TaxID=3483 RepID=A0A803PIC4_CANSA
MMGKETVPQINRADSVEGCSPTRNDNLEPYSTRSSDMEGDLETCRVCQCAESDKRGDAALEFLGVTPPLHEAHKSDGALKPDNKLIMNHAEKDVSVKKNVRESHIMEFVSPDGEVLICNDDVEMGSCGYQDALTELGCLCKNDLALVHYACALKWFVNHGSTVCEICGHEAKNIRAADYRKVLASLKEYEALRERTASGEPYHAQVPSSTGVDPDAVAAIRRQRLSEISLWFSPHNNNNNNNNSHIALSQASEQPLNNVTEEVFPTENPATRWAVEGTGILLATGLLTVTLAWLIAPRVGKKTAQNGLHFLLGGICALTVVVFFRFVSTLDIFHLLWSVGFLFALSII